MSIFALRLARVFVRVDVAPKALGFHARGASFFEHLAPDPYEHWEVSTTALKLKRDDPPEYVTMTGSSVAYRIDQTELTQEHFERIAEMFQGFIGTVAPESKPSRLGLRTIFVVEGSSFDELFPSFRKNALRHEKAWLNVFGDRKVRDLGFTSVFFGLEEDGVNLVTGVLTPEQALTLRDDDEFDLPDDQRLRIADGCLMIDLDRYRVPMNTEELSAAVLARWYDELGNATSRLQKNLLT